MNQNEHNSEGRFLTKTECTAMRGIAILAIVLHNYCHFAKGIVRENEYQFFSSHIDKLWQSLLSPDEFLPLHLLSFFGHYGVPVFLFLSGFGLVQKYESSTVEFGVLRFTRYHYLKLLRLLIVGFTLFLMVDAVTPGRFPFHWHHVIAQLLMYINVLPDPEMNIWPGIYWFFGLMMELYIVYRLLLYRRPSYWVVVLVIACWLAQTFCIPDGDVLNRLRYNFIGGMLPFGAGILIGRWRTMPALPVSKGLWLAVAILSSAFILLMSFSFHAWLWLPLVIIVGTIAVVKAMPASVNRILIWFGSISAAMFVAHPIARKFFLQIALKGDPYDGLILYILVAIALSWVVSQIVEHIPKPQL